MSSATIQEVADSTDLDELHRLIGRVIGKKCWKAAFSYGGDLQLHLGSRVPYSSSKLAGEEKGEWTFATAGTAWTLFTPKGIVSSKKGADSTLEKKAKALEGGKLIGIDVSVPSLVLSLEFSNGCLFRVVPGPEDDQYDLPYWELWMPNHLFVAFGPGKHWSYKRSDLPVS